MNNAYEFRASLEVAARAAQQFGATRHQIDMIVALARGSNDYRPVCDGRLTRREASRIIDAMIDDGAVADWAPTIEEQDAKDEAIAEAKKTAAIKKAIKTQKKVEKAKRQEDANATAVANATRRVSHPKFGFGAVIAEDEKAVTVLFDGGKKPVRIAPAFLTEV